MSEIIAKLRAFVAHPEVDSMTPVWSLTQDDAREILSMVDRLQAFATHFELADPLSFGEIRQAVRNGNFSERS